MNADDSIIERKNFPAIEKAERRVQAISRWKFFAAWSSLALVGQAASLQMIDAGRLIHFQHYKTLPQLFEQNLLSLILLAFQIAFVAGGIRSRRSEIKNWLKRNINGWQLIFIAIFLTSAGAAVTKDGSIYATSLVLAAVIQAVNLANVALAVWAVPVESLGWLKEKFDKFFGAAKLGKARLDAFSMCAALLIVAHAGFLSYFVYENHPHVPDETQYLFQARYFAAGQLTAKAPSVPEAFAMYMTPTSEPRWFSIFPPGWAAILAIGVKLNLVWLINPLLGGLCVLLVYLFFQEIYSRKFARLGVALLCCSPWFVFMAMSFMSHLATLACALGAAIFLLRGLKTGKTSRVFAAGLCIGILSLIRPLDAAIVAVLLGAWTLYGYKDWKNKFKNGAILIAGTMLTAALILPYNRAVTGDATVSPMDFYYAKYFWSGAMSYGFGETRGFGWGLDAFPGHSPVEALINAALNVFQTNTELFGWTTGSLFLAIYFPFSGKTNKKDFWAFAAIVLIVVSYAFFWYHGGPDFGARYWFLAIVPLVALTVRGIEVLGTKSDGTNVFEVHENENGRGTSGESNWHPRVVTAVLMLCVLSLLNYFPWRARDKYYHYLAMQPGILQIARENNFGKSLVLIRGAEHPDYQSAWIYNPLNFEGDAPIYAHDKSPEIRALLLNAFADRPVWVVDGPTRAGGVYQIARERTSAAELLAETNR